MRPPKYQKCPLFGKESHRRGDSLDRFPKFLGAFIRLTILRQFFKFCVIRITGYGVIAEKPRVGKLGQIFPYTLQEKLQVGSKNGSHFFLMGTTRSITMQSLGKILQRAPAVGAKMWCLFVFVTLRVRSAVRSRGAQFEHALRCRLQADFDEVWIVFSEVIALSDMLHSSNVRRQVAPQFSLNCGQKLRKVQKSAEKFVRTTSHFVQIAEGFEKNSTTVVQGRDCRCAPI